MKKYIIADIVIEIDKNSESYDNLINVINKETIKVFGKEIENKEIRKIKILVYNV